MASTSTYSTADAYVADNETIERSNSNSTGGSSRSSSGSSFATSSSSACANRAAREYLQRTLAEETVAASGVGDGAATVRLALTHDVFDVEQGLVGQIVYTGGSNINCVAIVISCVALGWVG